MPFYRRYRYYTPYWKRRYARRRRLRRPIWRTIRRRRRPRVRRHRFKKKLKKLILREWQPKTIKRLTVTGMYQLFFTTMDRIDHNNTLYIDSITPFHLPSGGGFSLTQFTLQNLFDQHLRLRNWWTKSNELLPLIRYTGATMYLYYQENVDYIFAYDNCFPMKASRLTYNSTQPSVMQLMRHRKVVPCKHFQRRKRPYKKVKIAPPSQLLNKWYFQYDLADIPLVNILCTVASLDRWYAPASAKTPTIQLHSLDTKIWQKHNFKAQTTYGYVRKDGELLFGFEQVHKLSKNIKWGDFIYLGDALNIGEGIEYRSVPGTGETKYNHWVTTRTNWGNPFMRDYLDKTKLTVITHKSWNDIKTYLATKNYNPETQLDDTTLTWFREVELDNIIPCRYNPYADKGQGNVVYFLDITNNASQTWEPPDKPELIARDLPLWTLLWGLVDWQKRANIITSVETHSILVVKTQYIKPPESYYVFLGDDFLLQRSPYFPYSEHDPMISKSDEQNWHPKVSFQLTAINQICRTGPGTVKLPENNSCEAHIKYKFHFKIGGCPPPMELISDPSKQPKWPLPNNFNEQPSLQSPATPFQYFLYNFDQRGDYLTEKAIKRLKKDFTAKEHFSEIAGPTGLNIPTEKTQESDSETSTTEEEQTTLQQQLLQQRKEQLRLRHRIQYIMNKLSMLE
nr:MAG: ORF1 [TTV-like mini virus]